MIDNYHEHGRAAEKEGQRVEGSVGDHVVRGFLVVARDRFGLRESLWLLKLNEHRAEQFCHDFILGRVDSILDQ